MNQHRNSLAMRTRRVLSSQGKLPLIILLALLLNGAGIAYLYFFNTAALFHLHRLAGGHAAALLPWLAGAAGILLVNVLFFPKLLSKLLPGACIAGFLFCALYNVSCFTAINHPDSFAFSISRNRDNTLASKAEQHPNKNVKRMYFPYIVSRYYKNRTLVSYTNTLSRKLRMSHFFLIDVSRLNGMVVKDYRYRLSKKQAQAVSKFKNITYEGPFFRFVLVTDETLAQKSTCLYTFTFDNTFYFVPFSRPGRDIRDFFRETVTLKAAAQAGR